MQNSYQVDVVDTDYYRALINCQAACPVHTDASGYIRAISQGEYKEGYIKARQPNPFASACGRVCTAPCEAACRRGQIDSPISIRALKRFLCQQYGVEAPDKKRAGAATSPEFLAGSDGPNSCTAESVMALSRFRTRTGAPGEREGRKVAVIGTGPAGLTAAHDLALLGYQVVLFEAQAFAGGKMRTEIPAPFLPGELLEREVQATIEMGVELRYHTSIDTNRLVELKGEGYEAIFVATGGHTGHKLSRLGSGIFAEGDMPFPIPSIIWSVAAGHEAARNVDGYLKGVGAQVARKAWMAPAVFDYDAPRDRLEVERGEPRMTPWSGEGISVRSTLALGMVSHVVSTPLSEVEDVYSEAEARVQADRCLRCNVQTVFNGDLCILCGGCVDVCPQNCYKMVRLDKIQGDENLEALVQARYGKPLEAFHKGGDVLDLGTAMIKDETRCVRCGLCAQRCPVGAITMEAFWYEEELVPYGTGEAAASDPS
ncbi:MAG: 4Fe-4S binding protein [Dehalococcoidia bacterium]